jgi:hypothetical protein
LKAGTERKLIEAMEGTSEKANVIRAYLETNTGFFGDDLDIPDEFAPGNPAALALLNHGSPPFGAEKKDPANSYSQLDFVRRYDAWWRIDCPERDIATILRLTSCIGTVLQHTERLVPD